MATDTPSAPPVGAGRSDHHGVRVVTRLPAPLAEELRAAAARDDRSIASALRLAVVGFVEREREGMTR